MDDTRYDIVYPRGRSRQDLRALQRAFRPALVPASWVYGAVGDTVRRLRLLDRSSTPPDVTVISVGNLEVGGSGKTPLCIHLLERFREEGKPAAYVSRGYGSHAERYNGVTVVTDPPTAGSGVRWLSRDMRALAAEIGDEGALVAERVPEAPLAFCRNKSRAVATVAPLVRGGYIVLDDAFQTWGVARDIDVVLLDAGRPFGDGWLLPAGTLREEPGALARADVVLFGGASDDAAVERARTEVMRVTGRSLRCSTVVRKVRVDSQITGPVVVVSAIARPEAFEKTLVECGVEIVRSIRFPDHHQYCVDDIEFILGPEGAAGRGCVVTGKDWVKLRDFELGDTTFTVAQLDIQPGDDVLF